MQLEYRSANKLEHLLRIFTANQNGMQAKNKRLSPSISQYMIISCLATYSSAEIDPSTNYAAMHPKSSIHLNSHHLAEE
jgi:hypothetical protein